jgi:hypothetical protein
LWETPILQGTRTRAGGWCGLHGGGVAAHHDVGVAALLEVRIEDRLATTFSFTAAAVPDGPRVDFACAAEA